MFACNLMMSTGEKFETSKDFYSAIRHNKYIDKYRDTCTRVPCCRKDNTGLKNKIWPLPPFFVWVDDIYINHLLCFDVEEEAERWVKQWIKTERKKFCGEYWTFPAIHVRNVFGPDVKSHLHPIDEPGGLLWLLSDGQVSKENFWNGKTMETYEFHDFFKTEAVNSIDVMPHWKWNGKQIKTFARPFRNKTFDWNIKLCSSLTP